METRLLIDGFNLLSRTYFATAYGKEPEQLEKNNEGRYVQAIRLFMTKLHQLERQHRASYVHIAWDGKRGDTHRQQEHAFYKAQRADLPAPLIDQYHLGRELLDELGYHQMQAPGYEADDIIGTLSMKDACSDIIYSNDKDLFQLLSPQTSQVFVRKKKEVFYRAEDFFEEYGIRPDQWVDVKALLGDPSDNIPGCRGVGEKSALPMIRQYGSLDHLYESLDELDPLFKRYEKKLRDGREDVFISRGLADIETNVPDALALSLDAMAVPEDDVHRQSVLMKHGLLKGG
ncbi:5'-3' exonuclease [Alkalicoccus chagannorensis]|uniref:5'-3' exonuclease n=1 Tax=Alkalicoccus chagannorensis TaxID=427072 RepID=UPI000417680D|nr:5'-3' exonuclease [Alkalicoccus chagannorensis]